MANDKDKTKREADEAARAEAEAKAKADADAAAAQAADKTKREADEAARAEAEAKAKADAPKGPVEYVVAPKMSITSLRGIIPAGKPISARDIGGKAEDQAKNFQVLVDHGRVVPAPAKS